MKKTHVVLILDRSGSMASTAEEAVNNYNDQVRLFQKMAEETAGTAEVLVSLITFNGEVYEHMWEVPAAELQLCKQGDFEADGWTAMLDGMGYAIEKIRETTDYKNEDNNYMFVVITDGQENKSKHYKWAQEKLEKGRLLDPRLPLNELMDSLKASGRWTFSFMGCDEGYLTEAAHTLNVPMANVALWDNSTAKRAKAGYHNSSRRIYAAAMHLCRGASSVENVYSDTLESCADFSTDDMSLNADVPDVSLPVMHNADPVMNSWTGDAGGAAVFSNGTKATWKC